MFTKRLLTCLGIVALTTPALALSFFIVQYPGTTRCTITDQAPAEGAGTIVGDGAYGDMLHSRLVCEQWGSGTGPRRTARPGKMAMLNA